MEKYREKLRKLRESLERSQDDLLDTYATEMKERYRNLNSAEKDFVLNGLDNLLRELEEGTLFTGSSNRVPKERVSNFDGRRAREIREGAGLSVRQLCTLLDTGRSGEVGVSNYECGRSHPTNPPRGTAKKYIQWLKEKDYNPFAL